MLRYLDTIKGRKSLSNPDPNVHQDLDGNYGWRALGRVGHYHDRDIEPALERMEKGRQLGFSLSLLFAEPNQEQVREWDHITLEHKVKGGRYIDEYGGKWRLNYTRVMSFQLH